MQSLAIVALVAAQAAVPGTVVDVPPLEQMVHRSDLVVHVVVRDREFMKDSDGRVYTRTTMEVVDGIKGKKAGDTFVVSQLGGLYEGRQSWISGAHKFQIGEECVFFGSHWRDGLVIPYGIGFGIFDVVDDGTGRRVIKEAVGDVVQLKKNPDGSTSAGHVQQRSYEDVDAFKAQLREWVVAAATQTGPLEHAQPRVIPQPTMKRTKPSLAPKAPATETQPQTEQR